MATHMPISSWISGMPKVARNAFIIGEVWNQIYCHGIRIVEHMYYKFTAKASNISTANWLNIPGTKRYLE